MSDFALPEGAAVKPYAGTEARCPKRPFAL